MAPRDPTLDEQPDFEGEDWSVPRDAMIAAGNSVEEAVAALRKSWENNHRRDVEAWEEHLQQMQAEQEQEERDLIIPEVVLSNPPRSEGGGPDWKNQPTPSFLDVLPAQHILKRLRKKEYVELWHFTAQGCRDAASSNLATPNGSFNLVSTDKGLMIQEAGEASIASRVVKDEDLPFNQWSEGKNRFLGCLESNGWSKDEAQEMARFFLNLDFDPLRGELLGEEAVMRYQERVRKHWMTALREGRAYEIGTINRTLLLDFHRQVLSEAQIRNIVSRPFNPQGILLTSFLHVVTTLTKYCAFVWRQHHTRIVPIRLHTAPHHSQPG